MEKFNFFFFFEVFQSSLKLIVYNPALQIILMKAVKVCLEDGCTNKARCADQLCQKHGGKPCAIDGCTTTARARGAPNMVQRASVK